MRRRKGSNEVVLNLNGRKVEALRPSLGQERTEWQTSAEAKAKTEAHCCS